VPPVLTTLKMPFARFQVLMHAASTGAEQATVTYDLKLSAAIQDAVDAAVLLYPCKCTCPRR